MAEKKEPEVIKTDEMVKREELVKKEQEYDELMDRYKRVLAEFENYKKEVLKKEIYYITLLWVM